MNTEKKIRFKINYQFFILPKKYFKNFKKIFKKVLTKKNKDGRIHIVLQENKKYIEK